MRVIQNLLVVLSVALVAFLGGVVVVGFWPWSFVAGCLALGTYGARAFWR